MNAARTFRNLLLLAFALAGAAFPARAGDPATLAQAAGRVYNAAIDDEEAGRYQSACYGYRDAAERFEGAIYALLGQPMQTEEQRDGVKAYADNIQELVDKAKSAARDVCGKSDRVPEPPASSPSAEAETPPPPAEPEIQLTGTLKEANDFTVLALSQFTAQDTAQGCVSARKARNLWVKLLDEMSNAAAAIAPIRENIAMTDKWLVDSACPADPPHLATVQMFKDEMADALVAFHTATAANDRNDFGEACVQMKASAAGFVRAKTWNGRARTVEGHEALNAEAIDENDTALDTNIGVANGLAKTYCTQAGLPYEEAVSTP